MPDDRDQPAPAAPVPGAGKPPARPNPSTRAGASVLLDDREKQIRDDYEWCLHAPEVRRAHGGRVVAVCRRHIWGVGATHAAALAAARQAPGCPPRENLALAVVPSPEAPAGLP